MDQAIKAEWVAALRSGEYMQGHGYLRDRDNKMCCLGVLCEIAVKHGVIPAGHITDDRECYYYDDRTDSYPSGKVVDWAGLPRANPRIPFGNEGYESNLAQLNDDGTPFTGIADLIEAHL